MKVLPMSQSAPVHSIPNPSPDQGEPSSLSAGGSRLGGLPNKQYTRVLRVLLALIVGVYVVYSSFGIAAPFLWGHNGFHGATYAQRARMTQRFHIVTPATWGGHVRPPEPQSYYLHHPIGYHHLLVPAFVLLGDSEPVVRGVAVAGGILLLLLLYRLVRRWWSEEGALLACAVYVALPILCSFSTLSDPMLLEMSCSILAVDSFLRFLDRPTRRDLVLGCAALSIGGLLMWEVFFQAFFHGLFVLVYMLTPKGRSARLGRWNAPRMWFLWTFLTTSAVMAFHFLFTWKIGMLPDFLSSYSERHTAVWKWVADQHKRWFLLLYGREVWGWGALWLAVFLGRLCVGKAKLRDQAVLLFFLINTLYIGLFAKGSAIHLYRVFYYSTFFALAVMDLVSGLYDVLLRLRTPLGLARLGIAGVVVGYFVTVVPHSFHNLIESREVMGTHGHPGYNPEYEKLLFAKEVANHTQKTDSVVYYNLVRRMEFEYYVDRSFAVSPWGITGSLSSAQALHKDVPRLVLLTDTRYLQGDAEQSQLAELLTKHPAYSYAGYLMVLLGENQPGLREFRYVPQRPSPWWRFFVSHKYPPLAAQPTLTRWGQCMTARAHLPLPTELATSAPLPLLPELPEPLPPKAQPDVAADWQVENSLCHHNYQVTTGQLARAQKYLQALRRNLQAQELPLGSAGKLVGYRVGKTRIELLLQSHGMPERSALRYRLRSVVDGKVVTGETLPASYSAQWHRYPDYLYVETIPIQNGAAELSLQVGGQAEVLVGNVPGAL